MSIQVFNGDGETPEQSLTENLYAVITVGIEESNSGWDESTREWLQATARKYALKLIREERADDIVHVRDFWKYAGEHLQAEMQADVEKKEPSLGAILGAATVWTAGMPDKPEGFDKFMLSNRRLFREQITVAMRTCNVHDLADPDLKLIEKKLVSRVNRAMGRSVLKSVRITDHSLYESADNVFVPIEDTRSTSQR